MALTFSRLTGLTAALAATLLAAAAFASPGTDTSGLPPLGPEWRPSNPYRGNEAVAAIGKEIFTENCVRCHGADATGRSSIGANLQLVGRFCRRISDETLVPRCLADADDYFRRSVQGGKIRLGLTYMPPWKDVFSQEEIWALRTYVELLSITARDANRQ